MRIHELTLRSQNLEAQSRFYGDILELPISRHNSEEIEIKVGDSKLIFKQSEIQTQYHFAMNIHPDQIEQARDWIAQKAALLPDLDEDPPQEIIHFENWNAHSVYFRDADQNILEFIARHDLEAKPKLEFDAGSILNISEIGVATTEVGAMVQNLREELGMEQYSGDFRRFAAVGDVNGLFIVVNPELKDWFPTKEPVIASPLNLVAEQDEMIFVKTFE